MAEKTFDICTECGEKTELVIIDEETRLCDDCIDDLDYFECDNCQEYWLADVVDSYYLKNGNTICEHCYDSMLEDGDITEDDIAE